MKRCTFGFSVSFVGIQAAFQLGFDDHHATGRAFESDSDSDDLNLDSDLSVSLSFNIYLQIRCVLFTKRRMTVNASHFNPDPRLARPPTLALAAKATRYIKKVFRNQALCTGLKPG